MNEKRNFDYKRLHPFKWYILENFPFLEDSIDVLTNYQLFCKLGEMYNKQVDAINTLGVQVEGITDWFDDLDVQEEINNKLDKMAESGELEEIIASYINTNAVLCFNSVSEMKAAKNLINGSYARTLGFYNKNSGGGALYKIRTITNDDIVNNMDIIALENDNSLIAELISDIHNILCYGVSIDDENNNNTTIIEYVIDKVKNCYCKKDITIKNSLTIDVPESTFEFNGITYSGENDAITIKEKNVVLKGDLLNSAGNGLHVGGDTLTLFCDITLNQINAEKNGIVLGGSTGTYYNNFYLNNVNYKEHGIKVLLDNYHVGENSFYNAAFKDDSDNSIVDQYAFYCNATNYRATGFKFYNVSIEGSKGGFYFEGNNKLCEFIEIYGLRCTEASFNNHKVLKIKCNSTTIPLYGDIFFDNAKPESFDFSEYTVSENTALQLHGAFRNQFVSSNDLLGYEGHPAYTRLVLTKLPRGYDVIRTSDSPVLIQATSLVGLPPSGATTPNTLKLKIGDSTYTYNGHLQIFINNTNVTSVDIYASDGTTLVRSIPVSGTTILNCEFTQLLTSAQTQLIYSISNTGATSTFN